MVWFELVKLAEMLEAAPSLVKGSEPNSPLVASGVNVAEDDIGKRAPRCRTVFVDRQMIVSVIPSTVG